MAHESFEDDATAAVMNQLFVNIKVDREERPDVDAIYMDAVQAMTGRGGWPMTVFCTPTGEPFYGGTYYPRDSFVKLMQAVDDAWRNKREDLQQNVDALVEAVGRTSRIAPVAEFNAHELADTALQAMSQSFDTRWGGFGSAPKFPSTFALDLAMRSYQRSHDDQLLGMVNTSLDAMAAGGMYDHIGGGFSRYSVDEKWLVPHFEKMLYDQALLLRAYTHAWLIQGHDRHRQTAEEVMSYVINELRHRDGGFYSAEDADSLDEHGHSEEGVFYTWTPTEINTILGPDSEAAQEWWNIIEGGNFEGRSIPNRIPQRTSLQRPAHIESARQHLFNLRATRPRPGLDNKVLTEWNAMMLSSLCESISAFNRLDVIPIAEKNAEFLVKELRNADGVWSRSWQEDALPHAQHSALAHDLAHVVDAMTRMYELTANHAWLHVATETAHQLIDEYWDSEHGGLFTVASSSEQLIVRQKDLMDNATPSANSVAAFAFLRLAAITGDAALETHAHQILALLARVAPSAATGFCNAISASLFAQEGAVEIVIPGDNPVLLATVRSQWLPNAVTVWGEPVDSPLWAGREPGMAYVCRNHECLLPARTEQELRDRIATSFSGE
jgi:uncharacterized protein YyaL (SSP411 family)